MINFNGVDLESIAPVKIEDIVVAPIETAPVARQRAVSFGADFVRMGGGTRRVTITFALLVQNAATRENYLQAIRDWARSTDERTLVLPHFTGRHLECICTAYPEPSFRRWWESKLNLVFTCFSNPFWTADTLSQADCGDTFQINGSAPPLMTIERTLDEAETDVVYLSSEQVMTFSTIPAGDMVIDITRQTAQVDGVSIMQYYSPESTWITPYYGGNFQTIDGTGTIKFRERWI